MNMQMDAEFKKEQIGTLFGLMGTLGGGFGGWVVPQGCPPQKVYVSQIKNLLGQKIKLFSRNQ